MTESPSDLVDVRKQEEELRRRVFERLMSLLVLVGGVALVVWLLYAGRMGVTNQVVIFLGVYVLFLLAWLGRFLPLSVRFSLLIAGVLMTGEYILLQNGLVGAGRYVLILAPLLAAVLLGAWGFGIVSCLFLAGYFVGGLAFDRGWVTPLVAANPVDLGSWIYESILPTAVLVLLGVMLLYYRGAILAASIKTQENVELASRARAQAQEEAQAAQQRADLLARASKLARTITRMQTQDELAWRLVQELSETFNIYQANLFMSDTQGETLVLAAASGELGWQLVKEGWQIAVGGKELPGQVAQLGHEVAIAIAAHPRLPQSKAEVALPLMFRGETLGVLDIHGSRKPFTDDDIGIFRILVDQTAATLNTLRLLKESEARAQELRGLYTRSAAASWRALLEEERNVPHERVGLIPEPEVRALAQEALADRKPRSKRLEDGYKGYLLVAPLISRDIPIGYVAFARALGRRDWDAETLQLVETAAERLAAALDTARLLLTSRRQALYEEQLGRVGDVVWASPSVETLMERSVQELGRLLGASEVTLYMAPEAEAEVRVPGTGPLHNPVGE